MNLLKNLFLFNKEKANKSEVYQENFDQYEEIAKLVKDARIKQNLTIKELSLTSKIPEQTIKSIENNIRTLRPKYPFIRSILIKLEECLFLKKNALLNLAIRDSILIKKGNRDFVVNKFDLINTWQGNVLYFLILIFTLIILKGYFISSVNIIEIQNTESKIIDK